METHTAQRIEGDTLPAGRHEQARRERAENNLWDTLGTLYRWRRFIAGVTGTVAVLSVVISLLLPNWYRAEARLLLPESGGASGLASAILGNLSSAARSLIGGAGGDYTRYLAILSSRTTFENVIDRFDLIRVYELEGKQTPREDAIKTLGQNVEFVIDNEYEFLSIEVLDKDPERAAAMANFFVEELNRRNAELSSQTAGSFRRYVELRYDESRRMRDALLDSLAAFQRRYGVYDLQAQTEAFFDQLAQLRASALQLEIQYEAFREQLGPENPQVQRLGELVQAAQRKYREALAGREQVLPVSQEEAPQMIRQYANLEMERIIQERILELVAPLLEQARFEEQQRVEAVQVVDPAVPPERKAKPKRSIICIAATLSAFILAVVFVLVYTWWQRNHAYFARRLRDAAAPSS
ncbi:lipopolysaccharide biosynthesis protein [Rhodocaloribacter litoris]|uniref:GumC family protein n=1 Tax=Rhodocaloribacter litoris TaxID=2558931 RepID=UPI0014227E1D|nr:GNVR domain-containing protein [Rhodocaloribacter litoris]QXD15880.1 lipopolysaccharide biosynthesis protein [Rhodocaloribacter litoris]